MKELNDLNNIYQNMYAEDENKGYVVTRADKKGNTPAWQGYKAGKKKKDGKPMYRAADHLKNEEVETVVEHPAVVAAAPAIGKAVAAGAAFAAGEAGAKKLMDRKKKKEKKVDEGVVTTAPIMVASTAKKLLDKKNKGVSDRNKDKKEEFEITPEFLKLIESGLFSDEELIKMIEGYQRDPEQSKKDRTHSSQPDPSKDGFTGIGNMSIKDIMKMNAKIKAKEAAKKK